MNPPEPVSGDDAPLTVMPAVEGESVPAQVLEERIQRLEDAVALLTHHVSWEDVPGARSQEPGARIGQDTGRHLVQEPVHVPLEETPLPRAVPIPPPPTASLAEFSLPPFAEPAPRASRLTNVLRPIQAAMPLATSVVNKMLPASSLWRDLWWDLRTGWRMMRDPYYPMSTACKVFPLFALFYVTIWPMLSAWSGIIGTLMNYFVNAIVIYIAFKVIQRELRRYYEFSERYRR